MKFSICSVFGLLSAQANSLSIQKASNIDARDAKKGGVTWTGEVFPGKTYTFEGDLQQINAQITAVNPDYFTDTATNNTDVDADSSIERRWARKQTPDCDYGDWVQKTLAQTGINYLKNNFGGRMACGAPPATARGGGCSRVSCDRDTSIWLCNDNSRKIVIPCKDVAQAAQELTDTCWLSEIGGMYKTKGQMFTTDNWNVIVKDDPC